MMKKVISLFLALLMLAGALLLTSCDKKPSGEVYEISFAEANSIEDMKKHDGERVSVMGYMSTLSAVDGSFTYLMNAPYQSCPYCVPNTTQLSNTIAVYAQNGKKLEFTDLLIRVTGTLEFGDYVDEYGYEYKYRIKDATYTAVSAEDLTKEQRLWQQLAATGVVSEIFNGMYNYVNFTCNWGTYTANFEGGSDYLYPADAIYFITTEGATYNYGYKEDYFSNLIRQIEEVDAVAFAELIDFIKSAESLTKDAITALQSGDCEEVTEYTNYFGDGRKQYRFVNQSNFQKRMDDIFYGLAEWNSEWTLS